MTWAARSGCCARPATPLGGPGADHAGAGPSRQRLPRTGPSTTWAGPTTCSPPPARTSRSPTPGTIAGSSRSAPATCPRRWPAWTRPAAAIGRSPCRCRTWSPTGARCCWPPGCPPTPSRRRMPPEQALRRAGRGPRSGPSCCSARPGPRWPPGSPSLAATRAEAAQRMFTAQGRPGGTLTQACCCCRRAARPPAVGPAAAPRGTQLAADLDAARLRRRGTGAAAGRAARPAPWAARRRRMPAARRRRAVRHRRVTALARAAGLARRGAARRCRRRPAAAAGGPAGAAWPSSTSTSSPSAPPSCGPRPPRTAPNSPRWRSGPRWGPAGPG